MSPLVSRLQGAVYNPVTNTDAHMPCEIFITPFSADIHATGHFPEN